MALGQLLKVAPTVTVQQRMAQFVGQGEAPQRLREVAAEPDQVLILIGIDKTIGALWMVLGMKCGNREAEPGCQRINRRQIVDPVRVSTAILLKEYASC